MYFIILERSYLFFTVSPLFFCYPLNVTMPATPPPQTITSYLFLYRKRFCVCYGIHSILSLTYNYLLNIRTSLTVLRHIIYSVFISIIHKFTFCYICISRLYIVSYNSSIWILIVYTRISICIITVINFYCRCF